MAAPDPQDPRKRHDDGSWFTWFAALFSSDSAKTHDSGSGLEAHHHAPDGGGHDGGSDAGSDSGSGDGGGSDGGGGGD